MKPKLLIGLAAAAVVATGGAVVVTTTLDRAPSRDAQAGQRLFPEIAARAEDIRVIVIASKAGTVRVARKDDRWVVPEKFDYPASVDQVRKLLVGLSELRALEAKSNSPDLYASMEVEDIDKPDAKSAKVTLQDASGRDIAAVIVGKQRFGRGGATGDGVYLRKAGAAQAWLAQGRLSIDREVLNWLDRKIVDIKRDRVREAVVQNETEKLVVKRATPEEADFILVDIPSDKKIKSSWDVNAVAGAFEALELDDIRPAAELAFAAEAPSTEVVTFDGLRVSAGFAEHEGATWVRLTAASAATLDGLSDAAKAKLKAPEDVAQEVTAINARVGAWAYRLPTWKIETMRKKAGDLLESKEKDKAS